MRCQILTLWTPCYAWGPYCAASISSPALAKNVLTVGATLSLQGPALRAQPPTALLTIQSLAATWLPVDQTSFPLLEHSFGVSFASAGWASSARTPISVVRPSPADGCSPFVDSAGATDKVVLLDGSGCNFLDKVRRTSF